MPVIFLTLSYSDVPVRGAILNDMWLPPALEYTTLPVVSGAY